MKYRYRVPAALFVLLIVMALDRVCIAVAGPRIQDALGLTADQWGWVVGSFALAYAIFEIPTGVLADRIGPRRVLTRIVLWWSLFTCLTGLAWGFASMLVVRFLFGAGEAGCYPSGTSALARWFPRGENARAQSIFWIGGSLGGALTPLLVVPLMQAFGWRAVFFIFSLPGMVWAILWYAWFRDRPEEKKNVTAAELAEIGEEPVGTPLRGIRPDLSWRSVMSQPNLWWLLAMYHSYCWLGYFFISWMHTFLVRGRGYTPGDLMRFSWMPFVAGGLGIFLGGLTSDALARRLGLKWGRRLVGSVGLGLGSLATVIAAQTTDKTLTIACFSAAMGCANLMIPVAWAVCLDIAGPRAGTVSAAMNTAGQVGSFLTSVVFGYLTTATHSYNAPLYLMAGMGAISALLWFKIDSTRRLTAAI